MISYKDYATIVQVFFCCLFNLVAKLCHFGRVYYIRCHITTYHRALPNYGRFAKHCLEIIGRVFKIELASNFILDKLLIIRKKISNKNMTQRYRTEYSFSFWLMIQNFGTKITWLAVMPYFWRQNSKSCIRETKPTQNLDTV